MKIVKVTLFLVAFVSVTLTHLVSYAQKQQDRDSLVRLIEASSASLKEMDGMNYRIITGPARFLHNNTYLLCDSAVQNVTTNTITAIGNVQIIQQDTYLLSDELTYFPEMNLAQFRGDLVKLFNKKGDQLKTRYLDYDTKDSIATFFNGGSMLSANGDLIEGMEGKYEAGPGIFTFKVNVNMYSDSIFVRSDKAEYLSKEENAVFGLNTTAWKGRDTLFTDEGIYEKAIGTLSLFKNNYIATQDQEVWAKTIKYFRPSGNAELIQDAQIRDDAENMFIMGERGEFNREPIFARMTINPVAGMFSEEKAGVDSLTQEPIIKRDTLFIAGDTLLMQMFPMYEIDSAEVERAKVRRELADIDPMVDIDRANKDWLEAYKRNKAQLGKPKAPVNLFKPDDADAPDGRKLPAPARDVGNNLLPVAPDEDNPRMEGELSSVVAADSLRLAVPDSVRIGMLAGADSLRLAGADSLALQDSVAVQRDSTRITFLHVFHKVKIFRSDMRGVCDSLVYTSLDSIARFYREPVLWSEEKNQFSADSIQLSIRNNVVYKANLIENAFIISQEDSIHFDQIKSTEMVAYFKDNDIYRFDALGGVQAMLFLRERDSVVTLMNSRECKLLTARIKNQSIQKVRSIESIKSDMHPTFGLAEDKIRLRDFNWRYSQMPKQRSELSTKEVHPSQRGWMEKIMFPRFMFTEDYFPETYNKVTELARSIDEEIWAKDREKAEKAAAARAEQQESSETEPEGAEPVQELNTDAVEAVPVKLD